MNTSQPDISPLAPDLKPLSEHTREELGVFLADAALTATYALPEDYKTHGTPTILVLDAGGFGIKAGDFRLLQDGMNWHKTKPPGRWGTAIEALKALEMKLGSEEALRIAAKL
jgi:hypothetical protein